MRDVRAYVQYNVMKHLRTGTKRERLYSDRLCSMDKGHGKENVTRVKSFDKIHEI